MLEGLKWLIKLKRRKGLSLSDKLPEIILNISKKRSKVIGVVPAPTGQILEIILIDKFQAIYIVGKDAI